MSIWIWLIIGLLLGLVIAAIVSLIFRGGLSNEKEQNREDLSARLAKSEVKVAVLEDKLKHADADRQALRAKMEADYQERLEEIEADYRVKLAIIESERNNAAVPPLGTQPDPVDTEKDMFEGEYSVGLAAVGKAKVVDEGIEQVQLENGEEADPENNVHVEEAQELERAHMAAGATMIGAAVAGDGTDEQVEVEGPVEIEEMADVDRDDQLFEVGDVEAESFADDGSQSESPAEASEETEDVEEAELGKMDGILAATALGTVAFASSGAEKPEEVDELEEEESDFLEVDEILVTAVAGGASLASSDDLVSEEVDGLVDLEEEEAFIDEDENLAVTLAETAALASLDKLEDEVGLVLEPAESEIIAPSEIGETVEAEADSTQEAETEPEDEVSEPEVAQEIVEVVEAVPAWPEDTSVWRGEYYNNMKLEGEPVLIREDPDINFDWEFGSPAPELDVDHFSIRWTRKAEFSPGLYRFTVTSDDGVRLWVNERLIISAWYDHSQMTFRREMELPGGAVNLRLEYYENDMAALVQCSWERIG